MRDNRPYAEKLFSQQAGKHGQYAAAQSVDEIIAHLDMVDAIRIEMDFPELNMDRIPFGISHDDAMAIATKLRRQYKKRAGVRALKAKYGDETARDIVYRHSGRTIR